jgi:hypothetical protein
VRGVNKARTLLHAGCSTGRSLSVTGCSGSNTGRSHSPNATSSSSIRSKAGWPTLVHPTISQAIATGRGGDSRSRIRLRPSAAGSIE